MTRDIAEMTDKQYEKFLRRNRLTGLAAAAMDRKRREAQKLRALSPTERITFLEAPRVEMETAAEYNARTTPFPSRDGR